MKKLRFALPLAVLLSFGAAFALAEEGVRVAGSRAGTIIGGVAAIAVGLLITIGMFVTKAGREIMITPTGIPIPVPLFPLIIGVAIGLTLINTAPEDSYTLDGVRYRLGEETAAAVGFVKGAEVPENLKLPAEVEGLPVTSAGGFAGTGLREVVLPDSLWKIDEKAFKGCGSLVTVRFEGGEAEDDDRKRLSVGDEAFSGCTALRDVSLPDHTRSIGDRAFLGCATLPRAVLPGVQGVGGRAFRGCDALTSVTLSRAVESIGGEAFSGCGALTSVWLAGEEERSDKLVVGDGAFENCAALEDMELLDGGSIKSIGERAFSGCAKMKAEVPSAHLEKYCFEGCASLRTVNLNQIGAVDNDRFVVPEGAFKDCEGLVVVDLRAIHTVGAHAFENCPSLRHVAVTGVETIKKRAFANCPSLEAVGVSWIEKASLKNLAKDAFEGSEKAVLYDAGGAKARKLAGAAGVKADGGWWFRCEILPDDTLRLFDWPMGNGEKTGVFTVPGEWCGLPVGAVDLYVDHGYSYSGVYFDLEHEEIVVGEGVRTLKENCFREWERTLRRIRLPGSLETIERSAIRSENDMTVYTDAPVAVEYAEGQRWTVAEP